MAKKGEEGGEAKADLLVFGYACKLFRDDDRASLIDNEGHLIPWMGNESLKIDRYDGRGALYDLASHEPLDPASLDPLTAEEQHLEEMCDHERYRSLYLNEVEELTYKEEEAKRLQQQGQEYGQVGYDYGATQEAAPDTLPSAEDQEETAKPYLPPPELNVPPHLTLPETMKHNAIIERTALFIAQQGSQMEILMKLKQHGNKNFDFLSHNDPLHEFYKYVLNLIKSGSYVPTTQEQIFVEDPLEDQKCFEGGEEAVEDHYLHPSLVAQSDNSRTVPPPPTSAPSPEKVKQLANALVNLPPELVRKVIKRMVVYVVKNGPAFERAILRKKDSRFDFIKPTHQHHNFYRKTLLEEQKLYNEQLSKKLLKDKEELKIQEKTSEETVEIVSSVDVSEELSDANKMLKKRPLPVNFSIKKPKENKGLEVPSALPVEESSDEEEASKSPKNQTSTQKIPEKVVESPEDPVKVNPLRKRLKKSSDWTGSGSSARKSSKKHKHSGASRKDATLQSERKLKVAQFLKDLKKKTA